MNPSTPFSLQLSVVSSFRQVIPLCLYSIMIYSFLAALLDTLGAGVERTFTSFGFCRKLSLGFGVCSNMVSKHHEVEEGEVAIPALCFS